jgi:chaperonin cofactor prefoldin
MKLSIASYTILLTFACAFLSSANAQPSQQAIAAKVVELNQDLEKLVVDLRAIESTIKNFDALGKNFYNDMEEIISDGGECKKSGAEYLAAQKMWGEDSYEAKASYSYFRTCTGTQEYILKKVHDLHNRFSAVKSEIETFRRVMNIKKKEYDRIGKTIERLQRLMRVKSGF